MTKFGVVGSGDVGQVLARGVVKHGHEARIGSRTPAKLAAFTKETGIASGTFADVAAWGEVVILAIKGTAVEDALALVGAERIKGKVVIDATNPLADEPPVDGVLRSTVDANWSLMETLQSHYPAARFVKAFNSVGSDLMVDPELPGGPPTMFYCGNDADAKAQVRRLLEQFGFDPADMGKAAAARAIEPLAMLWCIPGFLQNDWSHAFRLLRQ